VKERIRRLGIESVGETAPGKDDGGDGLIFRTVIFVSCELYEETEIIRIVTVNSLR